MVTETRSTFPKLDYSVSHKCGVTVSDSVEGSTMVEVMRGKPGVEIVEYPAMFRIDGIDRLEFDLEEIGAALGRDFDSYNFQVEMSTHYGKMVLMDNKVLIFADFDEASQYLAHGGWLQKVS